MQIIRLPEVIKITGLSRSTIYDLCARGEFPSAIQMTGRAVGWVLSEVNEWIEKRVAHCRASSFPNRN